MAKPIEELFTTISILRERVQKIKVKYKSLLEQNKHLIDENTLLKQQLKEKDQQIEQLKQEIEKIKISYGLLLTYNSYPTNTENLNDIKDKAKNKLNQIIKQIDDAINKITTLKI